MLALLLKSPHFAISADESKRLALALKNLASHYNITPNPQVMAWVQLVGVGIAIYGPRIGFSLAQAKQRQAAQANQVTRSPVNFPTTAAPVSPSADTTPGPQNPPGIYKFQ